MRLIFVTLICVSLLGCSSARTVRPGRGAVEAPTPAASSAGPRPAWEAPGRDNPPAGSRGPVQIEAPEYDVALEVLFDASVRACHTYFQRVDLENRESLRIEINNRAFWAGDTYVAIDIVKTPAGKSTVQVASKGKGFNQPLWNRSSNDINGFLRALRMEMSRTPAVRASLEQRLAEVEDLHARGVITEPERKARRAALLAEL